MSFVISISGYPSTHFYEIDSNKYESIKQARKNLLEFLFIEEKLDFIIENYLEFEIDLLSIATRNSISNQFNSVAINNDRNILNRRIMNLLSVCKSYLDQIPHNLKKVYGESSLIQQLFENDTHYFYDNDFGYRFMESMRNHIQHNGIPVHIISYPGSVDDIDDPNSGISFKVVPYTRLSDLFENKKFKNQILTELKKYSQDDRIDIRPFIRSYVECLGKIQINLREKCEKDVKIWDQTFKKVYSLINSIYPDLQNAKLNLLHLANSQSITEHISLPLNIINRRNYFVNKNKSFTNLRSFYISNHL